MYIPFDLALVSLSVKQTTIHLSIVSSQLAVPLALISSCNVVVRVDVVFWRKEYYILHLTKRNLVHFALFFFSFIHTL